MTNVTNYSTNFGVRSKEADDYEILRYKKFSSVKIATILKHEVAATIDRWLQINDDEIYAKRIYFTVRDIFTFLKNKEPPKTLVKDGYRGEQVVGKPPRFDQVIVKYKGRRPIYRRNIDGLETEIPNNPLVDTKGRFKRFSFKEPFQDPKKTLQEFLAGNGEITTYCNIPYQKASSYLNTFKGLQPVDDIDLNIGDELKKTSNFIGAVSPDHTTFGKQKFSKINLIIGWSKMNMTSPPKDIQLKRDISKRFMSTASSPMHHTFNGDFGIQRWGAPDLQWL